MFVCALVLTVGLAAVMGILYSNFDGQMRKELSKEAAYLAYGVEQQGVDYLKNIKDKSARITYIDQDGTVLFDNEADVSEMKNHSDRKCPYICIIAILYDITLINPNTILHLCLSEIRLHIYMLS